MATISVGEVEAAIRLKDAVSPTVEAVSKALKGGVGVTMQFSAAQQRVAMSMAGLHKEALEANAAINRASAAQGKWTEEAQRASMAMSGLQEEALRLNAAMNSRSMDTMHEDALKLNATMGTSTGTARAFANSVGQVSTTLASSAGIIGINADAFRAMDDAADIAGLGLNNLSKSAAGFNAASLGVAAAGFSVGYMLGGLIRQLPGVAAAADAAAAALHKMFTGIDPSKAMAGLKDWQTEMGTAAAKAREMRIEGAGGLEGMVKTTRAAKEEAKLLADATALAGMQIKNIDEAKAIIKVETDAKKAAEAVTKLKDEAKALFEALEKEALRGSMEAEEKGIKQYEDALDSAAKEMLRLSQIAEQAGLAELAKDAAQAADELAVSYEMAAKEAGNLAATGLTLGASLKSAFSKLPEAIMGALQGGGDLGKSIGGLFGSSIFGEGSSLVKSLTGGLTGVLGKTIGGALGSVIPGLGTLLGGLVGGLMDKLGGLFGGGEEKKVNKIRDAFFAAQGGFVELQKKLVGLSDQDLVKKIFDAKTVEQFNAAVGQVNALLGSQQEAQEALEAAVEKYGFSIEELGPKFQAQKLNELATSLFKDFSLLTASGIDVGTVLAKMGPDLNNLVDQARATGQALPEAMRPMIDALIQSGGLVDENGVAFESAEAAGLTFAKSLEEGLQGAIDAINRLVAALTGIPAVSIPVNVQSVGGEPVGGGRVPGYASGFFSPALPRDYTFTAHQGERVEITPAAQTSAGGGGITFGDIIVQGASNPVQTGKDVVLAIRSNLAGLRTELAYAQAGK